VVPHLSPISIQGHAQLAANHQHYSSVLLPILSLPDDERNAHTVRLYRKLDFALTLKGNLPGNSAR
jgi:hypothetical protein